MSADRIDTLAELAASQVRDLIIEARGSITESITAIVEEAKQADEDKTVLALAPRIAWDLGKNSVVVTLNVTTRRRYESAARLDDPAQPNLPLTVVDEDDAEETASDKAALASILRDRYGDAMPETTAEAVRKFAKTVRDAGATMTVTTKTEGTR